MIFHDIVETPHSQTRSKKGDLTGSQSQALEMLRSLLFTHLGKRSKSFLFWSAWDAVKTDKIFCYKQ